jgi:hypothetical protein
MIWVGMIAAPKAQDSAQRTESPPPWVSPKGATYLSPEQCPGNHGAVTAASLERASRSIAPSGLVL